MVYHAIRLHRTLGSLRPEGSVVVIGTAGESTKSPYRENIFILVCFLLLILIKFTCSLRYSFLLLRYEDSIENGCEKIVFFGIEQPPHQEHNCCANVAYSLATMNLHDVEEDDFECLLVHHKYRIELKFGEWNIHNVFNAFPEFQVRRSITPFLATWNRKRPIRATPDHPPYTLDLAVQVTAVKLISILRPCESVFCTQVWC